MCVELGNPMEKTSGEPINHIWITLKSQFNSSLISHDHTEMTFSNNLFGLHENWVKNVVYVQSYRLN